MTRPTTLEDLARRAIDGDRDALDRLVRDLQRDIYGLALRMLWNRQDAEDATQEILVRVVTRLSQFDFRSRLKTWVYRVAVNYVLDVKKSPVERLHLTFDQFGEDLADGLSVDGAKDAERSLLVEEVKIGCTLGMLQCLDRSHPLAYVLGEILDLSGPEAADALGITPDVFRKRLQHARGAILSFTRSYCGLVSDTAACTSTGACRRRCVSEESAPIPLTLQQTVRLFRRRARSCGGSMRRDGHCRFTEPVTRVTPRSTSRAAWPKRWTLHRTDALITRRLAWASCASGPPRTSTLSRAPW